MADQLAFPQYRCIPGPSGSAHYTFDGGMTLRDYYIAHAPAAEIAEMIPATVEGCANYIGVPLSAYRGDRDYLTVLAKARREWADAMLKAREPK